MARIFELRFQRLQVQTVYIAVNAGCQYEALDMADRILPEIDWSQVAAELPSPLLTDIYDDANMTLWSRGTGK